MYALVEDGSITKYFSGNKGITIGDIQYPKAIFTLWTKSEREAIGIYEIVWDNSKKKEEAWYINTNASFSFGSGKVTASYGDATAKAHADTLYTAQDESDGKGTEGEVKVEGLKTIKIRDIKKEAANILETTDWYILRKADADTAVPSSITNHRAAVRTKCAAMETLVTNASNTAAIQTLYTYVNTADEGDPEVMERPLGEFPVLGS
jgi:hypothetical protein|tara:strand:+ start:182 stop:802 length:621 start_codon:yes stop_codon:yes gene_type:complete